jgi:hypothetical protein
LLNYKCWSFPPASEREAGWMTPRPGKKTSRE